jgi:hypothetical protein
MDPVEPPSAVCKKPGFSAQAGRTAGFKREQDPHLDWIACIFFLKKTERQA